MSVFAFSQQTISDKKALNGCQTPSCQIAHALLNSEKYLEFDKIELSQRWLDNAKALLLKTPNDAQQYRVNSLQSELFYYMGLYQFGLYEAQKGIKLSKEMEDSLYISNAYLLEGINWFEMDKLRQSEQSLQKAKTYFPKNTKGAYKRFVINREYIFNNIAQLKLKKSELDSSFFYNKKAYFVAKDSRAIANVERTFGELFLKQKRNDSAQYYFEKSVKTSLRFNIYDTALLGYGNLMECFLGHSEEITLYYNKGEALIQQHNTNATFQKLFYQQSLKVFQSVDDSVFLFSVQQKLLDIENGINKNGNFYVQNITNQYINSENKLLLSKINELDKQKNIKRLQLIIALFLVLILLLGIIIIRRKNKLQKLLLDQKNDISKDLHDDVGSGISSILIHADLLLKNSDASEKQQLLANKISVTGKEVSQRMNTFIWSLNDENNSLQHFSEFVKNYATNLFEGTEIQLLFTETSISETDMKINGADRKNLFYCIKEILNNALKHSGATKIAIELKMEEKKLLFIKIQDNGSGLRHNNLFGNGLKNIKNRIETMNGTFTLKNDDGLSTEIKATIG